MTHAMPNYPDYMPTPAERFVEIMGVIVLLILLLPIIGRATLKKLGLKLGAGEG